MIMKKVRRMFSIRFILILMLVLQSVFVLSIAAYLFRFQLNNSVEKMAGNVFYALSENINSQLTAFFMVPEEINRLNLALYKSGYLKKSDLSFMQSHFYKQSEFYPSVSSIFFGTAEGEFAGGGIDLHSEYYYIMGIEEGSAGRFYLKELNFSEEFTGREWAADNMQTTLRPWYAGAVENMGIFYSDPYLLITEDEMGISVSVPVFDEEGTEPEGVFCTTIFLSDISIFLGEILSDFNADGFITDREGMLIASTAPAVLSRPQTNSFMRLRYKGEWYIQSTALLDLPGDLGWRTSLIFPENMFYGSELVDAVRMFSIVIPVAVFFILLTILYIKKTIPPIRQMIKTMNAFPEKFETGFEGSLLREFSDIDRAFRHMAQRLMNTLGSLRREQQFNEVMLNSSLDIFVVFDLLSGKTLIWNRKFSELSGYSDEEISEYGSPEIWYDEEDLCRWKNLSLPELVETGTNTTTMHLIAKSGERIPVEYNSSVIYFNDEKERPVLAVGRDMREKLTVEQKLKDSVSEKEVLLKELYHRTKNNMNVILSMINLQMGFIHDEKYNALLKELADKIQSMSLVHKKLYESSNLSKIDLGEYLAELSRLLMTSYRIDDRFLALTAEVEKINVSIELAVPCGLLLSELLSNIFKYAFVDSATGNVDINLSLVEDGIVELSVFDDGVGVEPGFDFRHQHGLGLQTIVALAEHQMRGRVEFKIVETGGLGCIIRFPVSSGKEREIEKDTDR